MSRKRGAGAKATAASMVIEVLKKRGAMSEAKAVPVSAFKDVRLTTTTLGYTIANLVEQGIIVQTEDEKYYYSTEGYNALQKRVFRGYSMIFVIPVIAIVLILLWQRFM